MQGCAIAAILIALAANAARAEGPPFELRELPGVGRIVAAEFADLDGDARTDLFAVSFSGLPPDESRSLRVYYQRSDGSFPEAADWSGPLPSGAAAYDVVDLPDGPGRELVVLRRRRLSVLSFAEREASARDIPIDGPPTIALTEDERGFDRLPLLRPELGDPLRFALPGLGEIIIVETSGEIISRLDVGSRANFFLPPSPGPLLSESEAEIYFDLPKVNIGDVDGDGRPDLIASTRHEIRVFRQREGGAFFEGADRVLALERMSEGDHIRGSGSVRVAASDFNADGRVDLLITHTSGGLFRATTVAGVHLNRDGRWDLDEADQLFRTEGGFSTWQLQDLDGDGRGELLAVRMPIGILEIIEFFVTRSLDAEVLIYRAPLSGGFSQRPSFKRNLSLAFNFETMRPRGFIPTFQADVNGDGHRDFLDSGGGDAVKIALGGEGWEYKKRAAQMKLDSDGRIRFGDVDTDGLADFLIYDPQRPESPIRIGINRGTLDTRLKIGPTTPAAR